jgi:cytochrome c553
MPAFTPSELCDQDLDNMGLFLGAMTPAPATPPSLGSAERRDTAYSRSCASCHGAQGEGVEGMLSVAVFTDQLRAAEVPPNVMLGFVMLSARSGSAPNTPTYAADELTDQALADIVAHIWRMSAPAPDSGQ